MKTFFRFEYEEQNDDRDTIQEINIRFEDDESFDDVLKKRLTTFLNAIGSKLKVE
jgi:hypothetical protein